MSLKTENNTSPPTLENRIQEVKDLHQDIMRRDKASVADAIRIGQLLPQIQASRGRDWKEWVKKNCGFSYVQARIYMRLAAWVSTGHELSSEDRLMDAYRKAGIKPKAKSESKGRNSIVKTPFGDVAVIRDGSYFKAFVTGADQVAALSSAKALDDWLDAGLLLIREAKQKSEPKPIGKPKTKLGNKQVA